MTAGIKLSLDLQRRGYRVVVQQDKGEVTVYVGRRNASVAEDVKVTAATFVARVLGGRAEGERAVSAGGEIDQRNDTARARCSRGLGPYP